MPRISKVKDTKLGIEYGFMFDIQSQAELTNWFKSVRQPKFQEEFRDALHCQSKGIDGYHATKGGFLMQIAAYRGLDLVTTLGQFQEEVLHGIFQVLAKHKRLFINSVCGYFGTTKDYHATATHEVDNWILPDAKVRIIQWPNGVHWYAKIGDLDIVVNGHEKWDSKEAAERAVERFLNGSK